MGESSRLSLLRASAGVYQLMFTGRYALARHQKQSLLAVLLATVVAAAIALSIARPLRTEIQPNPPTSASTVIVEAESPPSDNGVDQAPTAAARSLDLLARRSSSTTGSEAPEQTSPPPTEPPVTEPPVTQPPVTEPPITDPPVTEPPVTEPPITEPPVTEPPVTEPPITEPPVTEPPVTDPPVTKPPVTSPPIPPPGEPFPPTTGTTLPNVPDIPGDSLVAAPLRDDLSRPGSPDQS